MAYIVENTASYFVLLLSCY